MIKQIHFAVAAKPMWKHACRTSLFVYVDSCVIEIAVTWIIVVSWLMLPAPMDYAVTCPPVR